MGGLVSSMKSTLTKISQLALHVKSFPFASSYSGKTPLLTTARTVCPRDSAYAGSDLRLAPFVPP